MFEFHFHNPTEVYFGEGAVKKLPKAVEKYGRILLVYGGGSIRKNGIYDAVTEQLQGKEITELSGVMPNPRTEKVYEGIELCKKTRLKGCLSDQLLGQFMAFNAQLGYVMPEEHVKKAVSSIFKYNFVERAKENIHAERAYILNEEKGLTPCTWPNGGRPIFPFVYYGEVWTGIEYEVAALLARTDQLEESLTIVKAIRDRHDGFKRNPFSENESGYYYARAMASWAVYEALLGYEYDSRTNKQKFSPKINKNNFRGFWCNGKSWGIFKQEKAANGEMLQSVEVLYNWSDKQVKL